MASRFKRRGDPGFPYVVLIWVDSVSFGKMAEEDVDRSTSRIPVISFRALLAMKFFALKDNNSRKGNDLLDRMAARWIRPSTRKGGSPS
jgi:hypothetical protein